MDKRHWPDGLQAAVEAKEGMAPRSEGRVLGQITLQHFLRLYPLLAGMTATALSAADELREFFGLGVTLVPPNVPSRRVDEPDAVFTHREAKRRDLVEEVRRVHAAGRPVLIGTLSVRESEELAADLRAAGVEGAVLNAKNDEREAAVVAEAGRPGAVTISTNMAGRGTDIRLGGSDEKDREAVVAMGGLYVIGTNRHESLRIDRQLRGRAGRQGDPGSTRFFISLEDDLFERYGLTGILYKRHNLEKAAGEAGGPALRGEIDHAQRVIEGQNYDIRRSLTKFSSLVEIQRRILGELREAVFAGGERPGSWADREPALYARALDRFGPARTTELEKRFVLKRLDAAWSDYLAWVADTRESIHLVNIGGRTPIDEFARQATETFGGVLEAADAGAAADLESLLGLDDAAARAVEKDRGPSSTWTYLVNEDQFGWGLEMLKGRNIGFAGIAAGVFGPLFLLTLVAQRFARWWKRTS
jgi:preprotein translocase subunit SecA